ncbi:DUF4215 domain-containing protein [Candidatus Peribacteria bacterium]|nr:MAG: DUF4215 domain-containing protein [Candidatus Peribacteria bacterium]
MKHAAPFSSRRTSFLLSALFALSGIAALQQSLPAGRQDMSALLLPRVSSVASSSSASSVRGRRVSSRSSSVASLRAVAPVLSKRRRSTGALVITRTSSAPATAIKAGCGDGLMTGAETCDDKNAVSGDGCSASCAVESGFECAGQPSKCWSLCGDGVTASNERCDDGDLENGDGCSASCKDEFGYKCSGSPSVCKIPAYCGNDIVETGETCDDGNNRQYDGCFNCKTE